MKSLLVILVLVVNLFGSDNQKIGVPYIGEDTGLVDSAVLAPDGNSFYTLKDNLVTQWQLTPLEKLHSFKTNIMTYDANGKAEYKININISNDNKRVILYSPKEIQLWDIKSKKHLKTNKFKDYVSSGVRSKYGFLTIGENNILTIWNDENLTCKKEIWFNYFIRFKPFHMFVGDNILIVSYGISDLIYFNLDTFKLEYSTRTQENLHELFKVKMSEFSTRIEKRYPHKFNSYALYWYLKRLSYWNLRTMSSHKEIHDNYTYEVTLRKSTNYIFIKSFLDESGKFKKQFYTFYQFDDAGILIDKRKKYFMGSRDFKKYLEMRTKDGEVVPMNDATFKQYNQKINLKD